MAVRILMNERAPRHGAPSVSINPKFKRMTFNSAAYRLLSKKNGSEVMFVQILLDDAYPRVFWLKPCVAEDPGSKKLDKPSESTRSLHVGILLAEVDWILDGTSRFPLEWDEELLAGRVDTEKILGKQSSLSE